jgi:hypothetical protein
VLALYTDKSDLRGERPGTGELVAALALGH